MALNQLKGGQSRQNAGKLTLLLTTAAWGNWGESKKLLLLFLVIGTKSYKSLTILRLLKD